MKNTTETFRLDYFLVTKIRTGTSPFHVLLGRRKEEGVQKGCAETHGDSNFKGPLQYLLKDLFSAHFEQTASE
jgi:hypothetical protein